jgi:hypothetical protein
MIIRRCCPFRPKTSRRFKSKSGREMRGLIELFGLIVSKAASASFEALANPLKIGGPSRTRTLDPLIKSQLLYQLS